MELFISKNSINIELNHFPAIRDENYLITISIPN